MIMIAREIFVTDQIEGQELVELNIQREGEYFIYPDMDQWINNIP